MTVMVATEEIDGWKFESPEYAAVMECAPTERFAAVNCAEPALRVAGPSEDCESRNETVPVGAAEPLAGATLALSVTLVPDVICVAEAESNVLVVTLPGTETTTAITDEVEAVKLVSPE